MHLDSYYLPTCMRLISLFHHSFRVFVILTSFLVSLMKLYPFTQEHTMIGYRDNLYIFGGEVGFSNGVETPLWIYNITVRPKTVRLFFNLFVHL